MAAPRLRSPLLTACALLALSLAAACTAGDAADDSTIVAQAGLTGDSAQASGTPLALPVAVDDVTDGDLILTVLTGGQVRSEAESRLRAEVAGVVEAVLVRPGQTVRKGQPLVRLEAAPFDIALRRAEAAVEEARLRYEDNIVPDSVATGRGVSAERRQNAEIRSGLRAARLALEQARLDRARAEVVAPFNGVIDRVEVAMGERISAGQNVVTVVDMANLRIEAAVLEHDIPLIREGGVAMVTTSAAPDQVSRGQIVAVLPIIDSVSRAGRAYVRLAGNSVLRPGMSVDVRLEARRLPNRRLVPTAAITERDGRKLVFVVNDDNKAEWTYINAGRSNGIHTEVLPDSTTGEIPVRPGHQVIVRGHLTLTHLALVRPVRRDDQP
jgi:RND family efflux transporter MFP subunit